MSQLSWKYIKPLASNELIDQVESICGVRFPDSLRQCIIQNNGGRPATNSFDTIDTKERVVKTLLSFNSSDKENIYVALEFFKNEQVNNLIPLANDPFGNYICMEREDKEIYFLNHDNLKTEFIAKDYEAFLNMLYD